MRLRITFAKTEAMRYTGHLDLHRTWERTMRRAGLPLAYSQGFKPHPRINLASALPLGFTSKNEVVDIWLEQELALPEVAAALRRASPPGLELCHIEEVDLRAPTLQTQLRAAEFTIVFLEPVPDLDERVAALLASPSVLRQRRNKTYDLRPLIHSLHRLPDEAGHQRLEVRLAAQEGATGRPEEVILALGGEPAAAQVHRNRLIFAEN